MADSESQQASREQWDAAASSWKRAAEEEETGASADATRWMLAAADLQPGERVLELACGAGRVGLQAAEEVGAKGTVLCSDFSEAMVEAVRERCATLGTTNVSARVLDAELLALDEGEVIDVVLCRFGYMLMADPLQALRESARVLRPGGRLVLAVWGKGRKNPWLMTILEAMMARLNAPPPQPGTPGPFALGDPSHVQGLLGAAGLAEVEVEEIETEQHYDSLDEWWEHLIDVSGPLAAILNALSKADAAAIHEAALSEAQRFVAEDGSAVFPAVVIGARARKPT